MQVFHFLNVEFGLDNIRRRRLKISLIEELNDPFELLCMDLSDAHVRDMIQKTKADLAAQYGMLCFSRGWDNPVQWGHYADRHRGICLGFEVPDEQAAVVSYTAKRLVQEAHTVLARDRINEQVIRRLLTTKYAHWRYEKEVRVFVSLAERDEPTGLYFSGFSKELKLTQVIVGVCSDISRAQLAEVLGPEHGDVEVFKAGLSFSTFRVVRNRDAAF